MFENHHTYVYVHYNRVGFASYHLSRDPEVGCYISYADLPADVDWKLDNG